MAPDPQTPGQGGDGLALAGLGLLLHRRSKPGSLTRAVAEIIGPCAAFASLCGILFGEFFGDLGHSLGLKPILYDRGEAAVASRQPSLRTSPSAARLSRTIQERRTPDPVAVSRRPAE